MSEGMGMLAVPQGPLYPKSETTEEHEKSNNKKRAELSVIFWRQSQKTLFCFFISGQGAVVLKLTSSYKSQKTLRQSPAR